MIAPVPAVAEKKVETPKALEPAKAEVKAKAKLEAAKLVKTSHKTKKAKPKAAKAKGTTPAPAFAAAPTSKKTWLEFRTPSLQLRGFDMLSAFFGVDDLPLDLKLSL